MSRILIINQLKLNVMDSNLFQVIKIVYAKLLRPLFVEKIQASPTKVDDMLLAILDKLFDYGTDSKN